MIGVGLSPFEQTLIGAAVGAAGAIAGGIVAVGYQNRLAVKVARRLRLDQRREDGLLATIEAAGAFEYQIESSLHDHRTSPDALFQTGRWIAAQTALAQLGRQWRDAVEQGVGERTRGEHRRLMDQWAEAERILDAHNPPPADFWAALEVLGQQSASFRAQIEEELHDPPRGRSRVERGD